MNQLFLLSVISCWQSVKLLGVELQCPVFKEGVNEILCKINKTEIRNAECSDMYKYVTFDHIDRRNNQAMICAAKSVCNPVKSLSPQNCCCDDTDEEIKTCKLFYFANRSHDEGAQLECKYCIDPVSVNVMDEARKNISFEKEMPQPPLITDTRSSGAEMIMGTTALLTGLTFCIVYDLSGYDW